MKKLLFLIPIAFLTSCGGSADTEEQTQVEDTIFTADHELIVAAQELKDKLAGVHASFVEIGDKEVEETICTESSTVPYSGNEGEMNIWLMSTYILDNFAADNFGKNDFGMPDALIRNETPLSALNWMNINSLNGRLFDVYREYPDLKDIPKEVTNDAGETVSNQHIVEFPKMVLDAIEDGILGVVVITDYLPPSIEDETTYETGYMMGYILFADWQTEELSCITPFLAQNNETFDFSGSRDVSVLEDDLKVQTFAVIDSIARARTGFTGEVLVNNANNLEGYLD